MKYKYNGQWLTIPTGGGGSGLPDPSAADKMLISNDSLEWEEIDKEDVGTPTWTGTQAEYEVAKSDIADGTIVNITDDDGNMVGARTTEIYSTDEIVIGKWIDGKPIYRKTFNNLNVSLVKGNWTHTGVIINNINMVIGCKYYVVNNAILMYPVAVTLNNNEIDIANYNESSRVISALIVEYTKTTD